MLALRGAEGVVGQCFAPLNEWRKRAADVRGKAVPCGHYVPEEAPGRLLELALPFLLD